MTPELKMFLLELRQHPLFPELIRAVHPPQQKTYIPNKGRSLDMVGADHCFYSGCKHQHNQWLFTLMGEIPSQEGVNETSER